MKFNFKRVKDTLYVSDFWYDFSEGYIKPEKMLKDKKQVEALKNAKELILSFMDQAEESGLIELQ